METLQSKVLQPEIAARNQIMANSRIHVSLTELTIYNSCIWILILSKQQVSDDLSKYT